MNISTKFFGIIEITEKDIISFPWSIPGFDKLTKFVILSIEDNKNIKCLQSIEDVNICLLIISPWEYFNDYNIELSEAEIHVLNLNNEEDAMVYNIITVRDDKITANMAAPLIINVIKGVGKQIILSNTNYKVRQEIPCL